MVTWWTCLVVSSLVRGYTAWVLLSRLDAVGIAYALVEGAGLWFTWVNAAIAVDRDVRWCGWMVPGSYLVSAWLLPQVPTPVSPLVGGVVLAMLVVAVLLHAWALLHLCSRFTAGCSSWVSLCDSGPYRFIRHPQSASRLLLLCALCVQGLPSAVAWLQWAACVLLALVVVAVEETYLRRRPEYARYASDVPSALVPGLV